MKKFCNKITKQQWRVTVPNLHANIFKKSPSRDDDTNKRASSGSYDIQQAERTYTVSDDVPNEIVLASETSESEADEENFEDARAHLEKSTSELHESITYDADLYVELEKSPTSPSLSSNTKLECDVPKICFSFFENKLERHKSELTIRLAVPDDSSDTSKLSNLTLNDDPNEVFSTPKSNVTEEYSVPVKLRRNDLHDKMLEFIEQTLDKEEKSEEEILNFEPKKLDFGEIEDMALGSSDVECYVNRSLEECSGIKAGSDPNLRSISSDEDDGLYKVPRRLTKNRLSQSLNDFNPDLIQSITKDISIEHISCSQVIQDTPNKIGSETSMNLDYCKTRSKLPVKMRRVTLLRKPRNKAADTWTNLKTKVKNFKDSNQIGTNNIEGMYKSSKNKCKKVLKQTGMMFMNKKDHDTSDSVSSSQIIKNDAFFANLRSSEDKETRTCDISDPVHLGSCDKVKFSTPSVGESEKKEEFDFNTIKSAFMRSKFVLNEGQNGFDDLRRYVKQGGDFCKELATILQERSEAELQYAKSLSKLSNKLAKACREGVGGLNEAWRAVAVEMETRAETHRVMGAAILEDAAKPLKGLTENQHRLRKQSESAVDKAAKNLADWRAAEAKSKKHSHSSARENEKLQDALLDNNRWVSKVGSADRLPQMCERKNSKRLSRSTSLIQLAHIHRQNSDKDNAKLEGKKRKAEDAVKKADIEYYTLCVRAERARLDWESAVARGSTTFQTLEEERLNNLKAVLLSYLNHSTDQGPKLVEATERLRGPFESSDPGYDLATFINLRQSSQQISEQLLPDFYCEHITLAMNRERRKQALVKLGHLIKQDIERERKSKNGLENLSRAIKQTPNFGAEDSNQSVTEKLYHMKSMLTYLEGARYKVQSSLGELENRPKTGHPLAPHITITRDKSGLQQSVLKVPQWLKDQWCEPETSPVSEKSHRSDKSDANYADLNDADWNDRGTADGNSNQPDSDFDEFSSHASSTADGLCTDENPVQPIAQCKALYSYTPNLSDELALHPGDILSVYRQQDDGWWLGECNGSVGIFPATYVEILPGQNTIKC